MTADDVHGKAARDTIEVPNLEITITKRTIIGIK